MKNTIKTFSLSGLEIVKDTITEFYPFEDIIAIETEKPYLKVYTKTEKLLLTASLSAITTHTPPFFRQCNKSVWINLLYVKEFQKTGTAYRLITPVKSFQLARRRQAEIMLAYSDIKIALQKQGACRYCKLNQITV